MTEAQILAHDLAVESRFYTTAGDHKERLRETFVKGKQPGETTYIESLDEMLTLRMGFLYCFTGWPGSGKSEFLTQLSVLQSVFKKRRIAFYSPESYPVDEFTDTFIHCYLGKSTDRRFPNVCSDLEYDNAIDWCNDNFFFCDWEDTPDTEKILGAFKFLHEKKKVQIFVVDPFNSLVTEGEDRNIAVALKRNLTSFKRFAQQHRVMIWLVEHPKTPSDQSDYNRIPDNRSLFGGTMWWNKIDVGVSVHRPDRDDKNNNEVIIKSWKIKRQQLNGRPGEKSIHYAIRTNRYYEDLACQVHAMHEKDLYQEREQQPF